MKKYSIIILILFFIQSCGYVPIYSKNQKIDFYIQSVNFNSSDKELANFIKSDLSNYFKKNAGKSFIISATIDYQKTSVSKSAEAITEEYNLISNALFQINTENIDKKITISETYKMNNFDDEFEERKYEQTIKKNMARTIVSKLILQLTRFNVN